MMPVISAVTDLIWAIIITSCKKQSFPVIIYIKIIYIRQCMNPFISSILLFNKICSGFFIFI